MSSQEYATFVKLMSLPQAERDALLAKMGVEVTTEPEVTPEPDKRKKPRKSRRSKKAKGPARFTDEQWAEHKKARNRSQGEVRKLHKGDPMFKGLYLIDVRHWVWCDGTAKAKDTPKYYGGAMSVEREDYFHVNGWKYSKLRKNWFHQCGVKSHGKSKTDPRAGYGRSDDE